MGTIDKMEITVRNKTIAIMTVLAGLATVSPALHANAQPAPPPPNGPGTDGHGPGPHRPWMHGPDGHGPGEQGPAVGPMRRFPIDPSLFAMMYHPSDRKLTTAEVHKIAEAILLWFGNRSWKVTEVGPDGDGKIKFAYATADGSVIARFTMDTKTGRVVRVG